MADLTFTGFSPTLGSANANVPVTTGVVANPRDYSIDAEMTRVLRPRGGASRMRALLTALIGAAAGAASATDTAKRVTHPTNGATGDAGLSLGGLRTIETETNIDRTTAAGDVTALKAAIALSTAPVPYVNDLSGNGGNNVTSRLGY
jgi:hypothetical protein